MRKYSENFERDYRFYLDNIARFTFCGTMYPKFTAIPADGGKTAKEAFFLIDSTGRNQPTCEPELLDALLTCKASVNFHIKQWAEGRAEGTMPLHDFIGEGETLEWTIQTVKHKYLGWLPTTVKMWLRVEDKFIPVPKYHRSLAARYGLPEWAVKAVEMQKIRLLKAGPMNAYWSEQIDEQKETYNQKGFRFTYESLSK